MTASLEFEEEGLGISCSSCSFIAAASDDESGGIEAEDEDEDGEAEATNLLGPLLPIWFMSLPMEVYFTGEEGKEEKEGGSAAS